MTREDVAELLAFLVAAFPRTVVSSETLNLYTMALSDAAPDLATRAVTKLALRGRGFPTLRELRDEIAGYAGDGVPDPDQAWCEVMRAVGHFGIYRDPSFTHVAITEAVNAITWREICLSDNGAALRAHFAKAYESTSKRARDPMHEQLVERFTKQFAERRAPQLLAPSSEPRRLPEGKRK